MLRSGFCVTTIRACTAPASSPAASASARNALARRAVVPSPGAQTASCRTPMRSSMNSSVMANLSLRSKFETRPCGR